MTKEINVLAKLAIDLHVINNFENMNKQDTQLMLTLALKGAKAEDLISTLIKSYAINFHGLFLSAKGSLSPEQYEILERDAMNLVFSGKEKVS